MLHFVIPSTYEAIVPDWLPAQRELVYASGVAEMLAGAGILHPRTRMAASLFAIATLVAVFPANVNMALNADDYDVPGGEAALWLRLPVQGLFIAWAWAARRP